MTSYPITLLPLGIVTAKVRHANNTISTRSIFTGEKQGQSYMGERFEYDVNVKPRAYAQAGPIRAALASLYGDVGTFYFGDPDFLARGPLGLLGGTPLVDGNAQPIGSSTLATKGWTASVQGVLVRGDFIQLGAASSARLYMVTSDASSDSSGLATLDIWPRLRSSPADGDPITVAGAKGIFELAGPIIEYSSDAASTFLFSFTAREAL